MDTVYKKQTGTHLLEKKLSYAVREKLSLEARLRSAEKYSQSLQRQLLIAQNQLQVIFRSKKISNKSEHLSSSRTSTMVGQGKRQFARSAFDESDEGKEQHAYAIYGSVSDNDSPTSSSAASPVPPLDSNKTRSVSRLATIMARNKNLPPHLRSSYVVEELPGLGEEAMVVECSR